MTTHKPTAGELRFEDALAELEQADPEQAQAIRQALAALSRLCDRLGAMADAGGTIDDAARSALFLELDSATAPVRDYMRKHTPHLLNETQH